MPEEETRLVLPKVQFIENVSSYMGTQAADAVIQQLNETYRQYKMAESQLIQKKARLLGKLPEIQKALDIVRALIQYQEQGDGVTADFELADQVFAKATLKDVHTVSLWLGAGVVVEYQLEEARELLETNLDNCKTNIETFSADIDFVKDNCITLEVSMARVYNYDVERRRHEKEGN